MHDNDQADDVSIKLLLDLALRRADEDDEFRDQLLGYFIIQNLLVAISNRLSQSLSIDPANLPVPGNTMALFTAASTSVFHSSSIADLLGALEKLQDMSAIASQIAKLADHPAFTGSDAPPADPAALLKLLTDPSE